MHFPSEKNGLIKKKKTPENTEMIIYIKKALTTKLGSLKIGILSTISVVAIKELSSSSVCWGGDGGGYNRKNNFIK